MFALNVWNPFFIDSHLEASPVGGLAAVVTDRESPLSSKETLAEEMLFSVYGFAFDACLLWSLMAAYLLPIASLLFAYLRPSSCEALDGPSLVIATVELVAAFVSTFVRSWILTWGQTWRFS